MSVELVTKFAPYVDEQFSAVSKRGLLTNNDFSWTGAHSVKVYKLTTSQMNDYDREGTNTDKNWSRYGAISPLEATTEELTLKKDRSFTFVTDKLDEDETAGALDAAKALARQSKEVIIPEVDSYTYGVMCKNAGTKPVAIQLTAENIYTEILKGSEALDDAEVPEVGRVLVVKPSTYAILKKCKDITMETDIGQEQRQRGVIGMIDGCEVVKVPAVRLPADFGFMIAHPCATVAPVKLEEYNIHRNPPGISGSLVEGRVCYDAFVLENKAKGIYYQEMQ